MTGPTIGLLLVALVSLGCTAWLGWRIRSVERRIQLGPERSLMQDITKVRVGASQAAVERLLGPPDDRTTDEWVYFFSPHAGYRIIFNANGGVEAIRESIG